MNNKLVIWFIDDEGQQRQDVKDCFDLEQEFGEFEDNIFIKVVNSGQDGKLAFDSLSRMKNSTGHKPDIIFCDLRFSDENIEEISSVLDLGGVKLMQKISKLPEYEETLILTFTQMPLSDDDKTKIQNVLKHGKRVGHFIDKVAIGFDSIQLNEIENIRINKSCDNLRGIVKKISEAYRAKKK
jgi:CheY-like chemotaxis protein